VRVVIAEDEALLRQGLTLVLRDAGFDVVVGVPDADALLAAVAELTPDLVITDIRMPPTRTTEGLTAALAIRSRYPGIAVVVLSQYVVRQYALDLLAPDAAGVGYLLKQRIADIDTFVSDLRRVAAGGTALDPEVVDLMLARAARGEGEVRRLTARQREVLALMAQGRSNAAIAASLVLSEKAVVQHTSHIYDALGIPASTDDHRRVLAVIRHLGGRAG